MKTVSSAMVMWMSKSYALGSLGFCGLKRLLFSFSSQYNPWSGIAPHELPKIFERFYKNQLYESRTIANNNRPVVNGTWDTELHAGVFNVRFKF